MAHKIVSYRRCIATRKSHIKEEMIRLFIEDDGNYHVDENQNKKGRGVYLAKSEEMFSLLKRKNILQKLSKGKNVDYLLNEIEAYLKKKEGK